MAGRSRSVHNGILRSIADEDFDVLNPLLLPVELEARSILQEANSPLEQLYFIESGFVSRIALTDDAGAMEVALAGSADLIGVGAVLGTRTSLHRSLVVVPGEAKSLMIEHLSAAINLRPSIRDHLLKYVQTFMTHSSALALCNSQHSVQERVARWLLVASAQIDSPELKVSQELLSSLLGVRRAGVTVALINLEEQGLVRRRRGQTVITDTEGLERSSCGCHRVFGRHCEAIPETTTAWAAYHC